MAKKRYSRYVVSKWAKTKAIIQSPLVKSSVPETKVMTRHALRELLDKYGMVYIKPDKGTHGNGVMRVERSGGAYRYKAGVRERSFADYNALYESIRRRTGGRRYLVQRGIHLLRHRGRRFDIRVMVQVTPQRKWEATGICGRVGAPDRVVTNLHNGGQVKTVETLLKEHIGPEGRRRLIAGMYRLGLNVASAIRKKYPGVKRLGLDVALDRELRPWVLEVNTCPDPHIFNRLKDKSMYRTVMRYCKADGRL